MQEAKQKQEIEKLREQAKASAELELQHERALSQMVVLDGDGYELVGYGEEGAQQLHLNNVEPRFSQLEGSQATIERVSAGSSGKRKGSEDDLLELGENGPPKHDINCLPAGSPLFKKRAIASRSAAAKDAPFKSEWQLRNAAIQDKTRTKTKAPSLPLNLDRKGRPLKPVLCGSRMKFNSKS
ncbi:hypothetical protein NUW54_g11093 [Trametes sanguinea]|uniref:Uncharacterized protein n=1 Tax=Trametes sanguinea TaxID=158606 RepID=A0ACC1NMX0_9APHY|nr:hypothetical protein NUW54_g11093 [Trametes sanguinea]